jgi:hypothetical protein
MLYKAGLNPIDIIDEDTNTKKTVNDILATYVCGNPGVSAEIMEKCYKIDN